MSTSRDSLHESLLQPIPSSHQENNFGDLSKDSSFINETTKTRASSSYLAAHSSRLVFWTLFIDALLLTLPISFLPLEMQDHGVSTFNIGLVFGAKAVVQLIANPIAGYLANRIGVAPMMLFGSVVVAASTMLLAEVSITAVGLLALGRALQGLGSACCFSSGMAHLADVFLTDEERGGAMGAAMGGLGFAVLVGPPLGGVLYHFGGRSLPFFVVGGFTCLLLLYQLYCFRVLHVDNAGEHIVLPDLLTSFHPMVDPFVVLVMIALLLCNGAVAMMEYLLPLRLSNKYNLSSLLISVCFLPSTLSYFVATPLLGRFGGGVGRSRIVQGGLLVVAAAMVTVPLPNTLWLQLLSFTLIGSGMAMIDGSVGTILATILDVRHARQHGYGLVFSAFDIGFSAGYILGSYAGSAIADALGFAWACRIFATAMVICAPLLFAIRKFDQGQMENTVGIIGTDADDQLMKPLPNSPTSDSTSVQ